MNNRLKNIVIKNTHKEKGVRTVAELRSLYSKKYRTYKAIYPNILLVTNGKTGRVVYKVHISKSGKTFTRTYPELSTAIRVKNKILAEINKS